MDEYTVGENSRAPMDMTGAAQCSVGVCVGCTEKTCDGSLLPCLHVLCTTCLTNVTCQGNFLSCPRCCLKVNINGAEKLSSVLKHIPNFWTAGKIHTSTTDQIIADINIDNGNTLHNGLISGEGDADNNVVHCKKECSGCHKMSSLDSMLNCGSCNQHVCSTCRQDSHSDHEVTPLVAYIKSKMEYVKTLLEDLDDRIDDHKSCLQRIAGLCDHLSRTKDTMRNEIIQRSEYLINLVNQRKDTMLQELDDSYTSHLKVYEDRQKGFAKEIEQFAYVAEFSKCLVKQGHEQDMLALHSDVANQCLHQLHQVPRATVDIVSMKIEVPNRGREQVSLDKLFGTLKDGAVLAGSAELAASFNVDMKWPTSIAVSSGREVVIAGKTGAFESGGMALFFDSRGRFHSKLKYDTHHVPIDVQSAGDGTVWLSNSSGQIQNITTAGRILRTVNDAFQGGSGQLSAFCDTSIIVSSGATREVHVLDELGKRIRSISIPFGATNSVGKSEDSDTGHKLSKISCLASNPDGSVIIGDTDSGSVLAIDSKGDTQFVYNGEKANDLKCPSGICVDPFGNILVADFTNDNIHLLSGDGKFLGYLLDRSNGLSCPNCLALDSEGHLYVGQYGGDIMLFSYMNCTQKI